MQPFLTGGDMISSVELQSATWNELPWKFEAGTPAVAEAVGLAAAVGYLDGIGMERVRAHELRLTAYLLEGLARVPGLRVVGPQPAGERRAGGAGAHSRSRGCTLTTSPSSSAARACASAPAITARSR